MTNAKTLTLKEIKDNTVWVAKMVGARLTGTYDELKRFAEMEECRDFDVCAFQPTPELQKFWNDCWEYEQKNHCWLTVDEFYEIWSNK